MCVLWLLWGLARVICARFFSTAQKLSIFD
jgi:hypothetical protein